MPESAYSLISNLVSTDKHVSFFFFSFSIKFNYDKDNVSIFVFDEVK